MTALTEPGSWSSTCEGPALYPDTLSHLGQGSTPTLGSGAQLSLGLPRASISSRPHRLQASLSSANVYLNRVSYCDSEKDVDKEGAQCGLFLYQKGCMCV